MVNFTATVYTDPTDVKTIIDASANTATIHVVPFMEKGKQKFMVIA
jgi:hypothetical protein